MNRIKTLAIAFLLGISFITKSQNTGPVAPEAVSFEPVDANNMVNMLTGDFSYVIPLLTVPSPEGGYPIVLSYHGGVTMDQEASWVGLGWNINPGAIVRNVNGYPDDWKGKLSTTITYNDEGYITLSTVGVGVGFGLNDDAGVSIGLAYTWGSYKSVGIDISIGKKDGFGVKASYDTHSKDFGIGVNNTAFNLSASTDGSFGVGANYMGLGISANTNGSFGISSNVGGFGVGVTFSSGNSYRSFTAAGVGFARNNVQFSKGDLNVNGSNFNLTVPIPIGNCMFYLSYSYLHAHYWYFNDYTDIAYGILYSDQAKKQAYYKNSKWSYEEGVQSGNSRMDTYNIPYNETTYKNNNSNIYDNQLVLSATDNYGVTAQGLSGTLVPRSFTNPILTSTSQMDVDVTTKDVFYYNTFSSLPSSESFNYQFYLENEITGYASVSEGQFSGSDPYDVTFDGGVLQSGVDYKGNHYEGYNSTTDRKISGNFVEWFTNGQIVNGTAKSKGFIDCDKIQNTRDNEVDFDSVGIGGFKITVLDGKTYHYSLPVYQFEVFLRKNGTETGDFAEQRMLEPYATSWLLTAVTGPDYIDINDNGIADNGDYGYWVKFDYGKLTDGYIWQLPYDLEGKNYETYEKEIQWGRKQIYYLNTVETRTHKAYFIKDVRDDGLSKTVNASIGQTTAHDAKTCTIPPGNWVKIDESPYTEGLVRNYSRVTSYDYTVENKEKPLMLKKIILVKKNISSDISITNSSVVNVQGFIHNYDELSLYDVKCNALYQIYHDFLYKIYRVTDKSFSSNYNDVYLRSNVNVSEIEASAVKEIEFNYDYQLCTQTPNSDDLNKGKLTLLNVKFLGKAGKLQFPPYFFSYNKIGDNSYDLNNKDLWGYSKTNPENWSLNEVLLPTGGRIKVNFEKNTFKNEAIFGDKLPIFNSSYIKTENRYYIKVHSDLGPLKVGDSYNLVGEQIYSYAIIPPNKVDYEHYTENQSVNGNITITEIDTVNRKIFFNPPSFFHNLTSYQNLLFGAVSGYLEIPQGFEQYGGGVRVNNIQTVDELNNTYTTEYNYTIPNTNNFTSGTICYSPYNIDNKYISYVTELPSPKVLYNFVTVSQRGAELIGPYTTYEFQPYQNGVNDGLDFSLGTQFQAVNSQKAVTLAIYTGDNHGNINARSATIFNNLASVGRLISTSYFNTLGQKLNQSDFDYFEPGEIQHGIQQETFKHVKRIFYEGTFDYESSESTGSLNISSSLNSWQFGSTSRITYPNIPKSEKTQANGLTKEVHYDNYDFYTGNALTTITEDIDGKSYRSDVLPAYKITPYGEMGSKSVNPTNKNMLSQEAASISYVKDNADNWKPIGVGIQTWKNNWVDRYYDSEAGGLVDMTLPNVWRKHKSFVWRGNLESDSIISGYYGSDFDSYSTTDLLISHWSDFNNDGVNGWQKASEIKRYNKYSQPLESVDINNHSASSKLNIDETQTIATASNAGFDQFTSCGFESEPNQFADIVYDGFLLSTGTVARMVSDNAPSSITGNRISGINAHTGIGYAKLVGNNPGSLSVKFLDGVNKYQASVWVHKNSTNATLGISYTALPGNDYHSSTVTMNNTNSKLFGDWYLFSTIFTSPDSTAGGSTFFVSCVGANNEAYFDDFRVKPVEASVSSYVYDPITDAITYILNNDNIATKYEYDDAGNLKTVYKETPSGFKKVSSHNQGYARPLENIFTLAADITASTSVNVNTETRTVSIFLNLTNNDLISRTVNLNVTLADVGSKSVIGTIGSSQTTQLIVQFDMSLGETLNRLVTVTGDIQAEKTITIDGTPATLKLISFTTSEYSVSSHTPVEIVAVVKNIGAVSGTFSNLMFVHNLPNNQSTDEDSIDPITLAPGASTTLTKTYTISAEGVHIFGVSGDGIGQNFSVICGE